MYDVLVFLSAPHVESEIQDYFNGSSHRVTLINRYEDVSAACQQEFVDIAMIWPADPHAVSGFFIALDQNGPLDIPVVAVCESHEIIQALQNLPLADIIQLPSSNKNFQMMIRNVLREVDVNAGGVSDLGWQGSIGEYSVIDLIQMIEVGGEDSVLSVTFKSYSGDVQFSRGQLIDAVFDNAHGMSALEKLALLSEGHFQIRKNEPADCSNKIGLSSQDVLIQLIDKSFRLEEQLADTPGLMAELMSNPLLEMVTPSPLQEKLLLLARNPIRMIDIFIELDENLENILESLLPLLTGGHIGMADVIKEKEREERDRSGLDKLVGSFSAIFRKQAPETVDYRYEEIESVEDKPLRLEKAPKQLTLAEQEKLERKLKGLFV